MTRRSERTALEAVAEELARGRGRGRLPTVASVRFAGKRIVLTVVPLGQQVAQARRSMRPRLRLDRVAVEFVSRVRTALQGQVPDKRTIVVTVTAPIRLASKTAAALVSRVLSRGTGRFTAGRHRIHGNRIRIWSLPGGTSTTSTLVGFVHNPDADPAILIEVTRALLAAIGPHRRAAARRSVAHWLLIADPDDLLSVGTYRNVCQQLRLGTAFERLLVALADGRIERLSPS